MCKFASYFFCRRLPRSTLHVLDAVARNGYDGDGVGVRYVVCSERIVPVQLKLRSGLFKKWFMVWCAPSSYGSARKNSCSRTYLDF